MSKLQGKVAVGTGGSSGVGLATPPFPMYELSVPILLRGLTTLSKYVDKAAEHAAENGFDPDVLVQARLAPDMLSFAGQVQRMSDSSKGAVGRLAAVEVPSFPDTEKTLSELTERIHKTMNFLMTVTPREFEGSEARVMELRFRSVKGKLRGDVWLTSVLLPNFFFHLATAHDILRHNGVKVGKKDYLGTLDFLEA